MCLFYLLIEFIEFLSQNHSILRLQVTQNVCQQSLSVQIILILFIVLKRVILEGQQTSDAAQKVVDFLQILPVLYQSQQFPNILLSRDAVAVCNGCDDKSTIHFDVGSSIFICNFVLDLQIQYVVGGLLGILCILRFDLVYKLQIFDFWQFDEFDFVFGK